MRLEQEIAEGLHLPPPIGEVPSSLHEANQIHGPFMPEIAHLVKFEPNFGDSKKFRALEDPTNMGAFLLEQKVGLIIASLPYVAQVRQVEYQGEEDNDMVDLVVTMVEGFIIPEFSVQVKNSKWGVASFFDEVGRRMRKEAIEKGTPLERLSGEEEYQRKRTWMTERRLIVINAGTRNDQPVTDMYIADKFDREMKAISFEEAHRINEGQVA